MLDKNNILYLRSNRYVYGLKLKDEYEVRMVEWKSQYLTEKNELKYKCEDLQSKLNRSTDKMTDVKKFHEKV